jgi:acetate kinase
MTEHLLTLNAGSSSVKFALFARDALDAAPVFTGHIDGIGLGRGGAATHEEALADVLAQLQARKVHVGAVGHRIVHGGTRFIEPVLIDDTVVAQMTELIPLAPLHQPHNLAGVRAARHAFAGVPQVACFDTAFHAAQPELNRRFALPQALFDAGVRRYGFHGLSYESILAQMLAADPLRARGRVVIAHLGNGASMCALHEGRSVATTMSFSPLDGLPMGTRCGGLDPGAVLYLQQALQLDAAATGELLNRESGLYGMSGLSSDVRVLEASTEPAAILALQYFVYRINRELGSLVAALGGLDALVFTGGIGTHSVGIRAGV